ncbi:pyruvate dehydrogenase [Defluviimonas sp. WL0050]|uniref:Pyruvate dehydrogenase n=1 Tax=Albidovulum litorale TaxID=2984134 RepID=A0ABT2ZST3_9RHOB|nr:biotin/lipoyl-containing protein [Defluviimonas sp. WL0050]MCV2874182.1 pyruvate dehydrogenase [Defluviimonas sp. WL0050]
MPHEVIMPALGMAQDTGLIVAWHKSPGDAVAADDVLFEVETDKATMEVPAGADGFVTQIRAQAGSEVPVGDVIALIGESREAVPADEKPADDATPAAADLPAGNNVILPALGMAQDTGLIVAWHKAPGDAVAAGDILFEVETDKSTMEVEAGFDGFVAALLAEAGEEAPVGETIAVITATKPEKPVKASRAGAPAVAPASAPQASAPAAKPSAPKLAKAATSAPKAAAPAAAGGRILASPKARRIALQQGLDLNRLAEAGHPQPYHVADLEALKSLPEKAPQIAQAASRRLTADLPSEGFAEFAAWAAEAGGLKDAVALLAGFAGASLGRDAIVVVESLGVTRAFSVPMGTFGNIAPADPASAPDLILRDLRMSRINTVTLGAEGAPSLTLTQAGEGLAITLECASHHLTATEAVSLLSNFAGRMEQPLRHLL